MSAKKRVWCVEISHNVKIPLEVIHVNAIMVMKESMVQIAKVTVMNTPLLCFYLLSVFLVSF